MNARLKLFASISMATALIGSAASVTIADDHDKDRSSDKPEVATIGEKAPDFTLTDIHGEEHSLSDYKGKTVVLEWFNAECPYVKRLYTRGSFKTQGNELNEKDDFVWLAINSNPPGTQGGGLEKNQHYAKEYGMEYPLLLDEDSKVGRLYQARTTPHMYVIDPEGVLRYHGAIDNAPSGDPGEGQELVNYVEVVLAQLAAEETVTPTRTRPYGCSVKYQKPQRNADRNDRSRRDRPDRPRRPERPDRPDRPDRP